MGQVVLDQALEAIVRLYESSVEATELSLGAPACGCST
jgi:hypothetical protein